MKQIECAKHGRTTYCLICKHLREQSNLSFYACDAETEMPAQAWCTMCDQVLEEEQGWSDRADEAADWKLFCGHCYEETLARHHFIAWSVGTD